MSSPETSERSHADAMLDFYVADFEGLEET
jgi:hypothetical protein